MLCYASEDVNNRCVVLLFFTAVVETLESGVAVEQTLGNSLLVDTLSSSRSQMTLMSI